MDEHLWAQILYIRKYETPKEEHLKSPTSIMDGPVHALPEVEHLLQDLRHSGNKEEISRQDYESTPPPSTDVSAMLIWTLHVSRYPPYAKTSVLARYIPEVDPEHPRAKTLRVRLSKRSTMLRIQVYLATSVFVLNLAALIWAMTKYDVDDARGVGTLYTGSCERTSTINSNMHVFLNVISSLFLGASNYCMQVLVAPLRSEIDRAHRRGVSLDIGVPSFRNLWNIQHRRVILWVAIGAVSTLLHLM